MTNFKWEYQSVRELAAAMAAREFRPASLEDRTPLKLAQLMESEFGGFVPPPGY